jgi:hypothetical protein
MSTVSGAWMGLQLPSPTVITKCRIKTYNPTLPSYSPSELLLLGSTNGTTWVSLRTIIDPFYDTPNGPGIHKTYDFANTTAYAYYRLVFVRGNGYGRPVISCFYVADSADTNYPSGYLSSATAGGYTLTSAYDLLVRSATFGQQFGESWHHTTTYITNNTLEDEVNYVGGNNYSGSSPYLYANVPATTTTYTLPGTPPSAPTSLSASAGNQSVVITFTPGSSGSSPITNYKYSINNGSTYAEFNPVVTTSPVVIEGLTNGQAYSIKLLAMNVEGDGTPSSTITVTPSSVPDAPTNLVATYNAPGSVSISFTPGSNQGQTITNYLYSIDCGASFTPLSPTDGITPITINGLTIGQSYCIELIAVNSLGAGAASSSVQYDVTGLPAAPTSITWTDLYNGSIAVSFVSGSDASSPILNYEYSMDGGSTFTALSPVDSMSPITISGLGQRINYVLVLRAVNVNGAGTASAPVYLRYMCFLEGTKILCFDPETQQEVERPIETIRKGTLVKTTYSGYKAVDTIGTSKIYNPANSMRSLNRLYKCSKENYPDLKEDLVITGCHSILVQELTEEERALSLELQGKIYATDRLYRLIAAVDKRAQPYEKEGVFNIWHLALENDNYYYNYGIYANGLLVETTSLRMIKEQSGMDLVQ